jgi:hypothetical protein
VITVAIRHEPIAQACPITSHESVRIISEIAERLDELEDMRRYHAVDLINRLYAVGQIDARLLRAVIALMHGRTEVIADSYNVQGDKRGLTKQAIHCEYKQHMEALARHFPELCRAIDAIREFALAHEDAMSQADAIREARDARE